MQSATKLSSALFEMKSTENLFKLLESDFSAALHRSVDEDSCVLFTIRPSLYNLRDYNVMEVQRADIKDFFKTDTLAAAQTVLRELQPFKHRNKICFPIFSPLSGTGVSVLLFVETSLDLGKMKRL